MSSASASTVRTVAALVAGAVLVGAGLSGCSSTTASLTQATVDARSAVSSAELAVQQQAADRTLLTTTNTALDDARTQLLSAEASAAQLTPDDSADVDAQQRALEEIRSATDAVLAAQRTVASAAASALPALQSATEQLTTLSDELQRAQG